MIRMPRKRRASRHDEALSLLDRERELLLRGPLGDLESAVAAREALVSDLLADAPPEGFLVALKARAERNSRLLLASLAGVKAAREQVAAADRASRSLKTYGADGKAVEVNEKPKTRDRRR